MLGRNRRARILLISTFAVLVFLYLKRGNVDSYIDRAQNAVGGGSVLRPGHDHSPSEQKPAEPFRGTPTRPKQEDVPGKNALQDTARLPASTTVARRTSTTSGVSTISNSAASSTTVAPYEPAYYAPIGAVDDDSLPQEIGEGRVEVDPLPSKAHLIHWTHQTEHFPLTSTIQLPQGSAKPLPKLQKAKNGAERDRLAVVKAAAQWSWQGYIDHAWMADELQPMTGGIKNPFNAWGATLVDSLDTLWIMGLTEEFDEAVRAVGEIDFTTSPRSDIPLFETTIRYLGGMIGAYEVSGRKQKYRVLLDKAVELAEILYSAFDTPNRMPITYYRWKPTFSSQPHRSSNRIVLAELGSLSLEFTRLAQLTGEPKFYDAIARVTDALDDFQNRTRVSGMWPALLDASGCHKPAQIVNIPPVENQKPTPNDPDKVMQASQPVQQGAGARAKQAVHDDNMRRQVAREQPGVAATTEDGDATAEGSIDGRSAGPETLHVHQGSKRQLTHPRSWDDLPNKPLEQDTDDTDDTTVNMNSNNLPKPKLPADSVCVSQGLAGTSARATELYTLGAMSDSTYEYLPKQYALLGGQVEQYRRMYEIAADVAIKKLLVRPMVPDGIDILIAADLRSIMEYEANEPIERVEPTGSHLGCFAGGMFAMGGVLFDRPEDVEIGSKLTDGCVWAYNSTATGIMPELFTFLPCAYANGTMMDGFESCDWNKTRYYEELDPYQESRLQGYGKHIVTKTATVALQSVDDEDVIAVQSTATPESRGLEAEKRTLGKRQLGGDLAVDVEKPSSSSTEESSTEEARFAAQTTLPTPTKPTSDAYEAPHYPIWTPSAPLSHLDYVANKISDERLPTGMTRLMSRKYILRPEAIESVFYMYRITGDQHWRDAGWQMFEAVQKYTRATFANSAIDDVTKAAPELLDSMESFWLAETLKYFYLLFDDEATWSLDDWVLNTEAHFFERPKVGLVDKVLGGLGA